jgi:hypothetical protein
VVEDGGKCIRGKKLEVSIFSRRDDPQEKLHGFLMICHVNAQVLRIRLEDSVRRLFIPGFVEIFHL